MEEYDMSKSSPGFNEKPANGPCSLQPSLAHVLAAVTAALLFIGTPIMYSLTEFRAQAALMAKLQTEVRALQERVDLLEAFDSTEIKTNHHQNQDKYLKRLLMDFSAGQSKATKVENPDGDKDTSVSFLKKLFRHRERELGGSESDTEWTADLQNTGPGELESEMLSDYNLLQKPEEEDNPFSHEYRSEETRLRHHGGKLSTNHGQDRDDVRRGSTNGERARQRPRRQTAPENRESRNRNREPKASKGAGKRNRGNRGSTERRDQDRDDTERQNGGARRQRERCQCQDERRQRSRCQCSQADPPAQQEPAYVHFVGNVSSLVYTHPERTHPLSPRMVNVTENLLSDWALARWTTIRQKKKFELNNGEVTVKKSGFYFIYSQVQFFDDDRYTGHVITVNDIETFKCAESPPERPRNIHTCYVGGLAYLHSDSRVAVRVAFAHRWVNMHPDSSYFGMYRVAL